MYIKLIISYCLIIGFLFINSAKSGFIYNFDEEGYKTSIKIRNIDVYFGDEEPENKGELVEEFDLNDLNDRLGPLLILGGISLGKVSFHRVNTHNELTAMEEAIRVLLPKHDDMEADGRLEKKANDFILSKLTEHNKKRNDSDSDEN